MQMDHRSKHVRVLELMHKKQPDYKQKKILMPSLDLFQWCMYDILRFRPTLPCSYSYSENIEFQYDSKSQLQQKYSSHNKEPSLAGWFNVGTEVESNKNCRCEPCNANNHPSEDLYWYNREAQGRNEYK